MLLSSCYGESTSRWFEQKWSLWARGTKKFMRRASLPGTPIQVFAVLSGLQLPSRHALSAAPHGHMAGAVQAAHLLPLQTFWPPFSESPESHSDRTSPGHVTQSLRAEDRRSSVTGLA